MRLRQATETLTIAASALLGLVWVSIVALFGLKLKTAYDIETFWVAVPLVGVAVFVWFALVFVDRLRPRLAGRERGARRGAEGDSDARRAWRAEAPTPARLVEAIAFAELPYWAPWFDGPTECPGSWRRDVAALRRRAAQEDASELGPETRNYRSLGERVLMLPTGESVRDVLRRCFLGGLLGPDAELLLHLEGARAGLFASRETRTLVAFFRARARAAPSTASTRWRAQAASAIDAMDSGRRPARRGRRRRPGFAARATRDARWPASSRRRARRTAGRTSTRSATRSARRSRASSPRRSRPSCRRRASRSRRSAWPRVGDLAFARHCASLANLRSWRVQNELDPVTRLAWWFPRPARYRHLAGHYVLLERGLGWCFPPGALAPFVARRPPTINWPGIVIRARRPVARRRPFPHDGPPPRLHGRAAPLRRLVRRDGLVLERLRLLVQRQCLCVVGNAVIFLLVCGAYAYSGPGWDDACVWGRRVQHVVDILGTVNCLCLAFMLVSLGIAKLVSRDSRRPRGPHDGPRARERADARAQHGVAAPRRRRRGVGGVRRGANCLLS